jgi:hypothetical protein
LEIEVAYDKGGANYFTGNSDPRGIYLYVRPIAVRDGTVSFTLGRGRKHLLQPANRFNRKQQDHLGAFIAEQVHRPTRTEQRTGIAWDLIRTVLAVEQLVLLDGAGSELGDGDR